MLDEYNKLLIEISNSYDKSVVIVKIKIYNEEEKSIVEEENKDTNGNDESKNKKIKKGESLNISNESSGKKIFLMHAKYTKKDFRDGTSTPKSILHTYTLDNGLPK